MKKLLAGESIIDRYFYSVFGNSEIDLIVGKTNSCVTGKFYHLSRIYPRSTHDRYKILSIDLSISNLEGDLR